MRGNRSGMTLVEVLAALMILAAGGIALMTTLGAAMRAEGHAAGEERTMDAASRLLAAVSLLTRADLDRRLGERTVGEFVVRIQRPEPILYRAAVAEREAPQQELVVTVLYRPEVSTP